MRGPENRRDTFYNYVFWLILPLLSPTLCPAQSISGTMIVQYVNADSIVIGVDSRAVIHHVTNWTETWDVCKVGSASGIYFTFSGTSDTSNMNIFRLAQDACEKANTLDAVAQRFASIMAPALNQYLKTPIGEMMPRDKDPIDILFFGVENGVPGSVVVSFSFAPPPDFLTVDIQKISLTNLGHSFMGTYDAAHTFLQANEDFARSVSGVEFVKTMLFIQSGSTPEIVGGESNILCLTRRGVEWIKQGECCRQSEYLK